MELIKAVNKAKGLGMPWIAIDNDLEIYTYSKEPHHTRFKQWNNSDSPHMYLGNHEYPIGDWSKCILDVRTLTLKGEKHSINEQVQHSELLIKD